ncbi:Mrp/NBP35 family ATP-binding protein [uncultured Anaerococcus sp.]|uniref:Mrp/NBP35 family ATP-binding protein n=1 Tax=uncultured Anaerococcus sp. TaxID=293428 RepID=UPI002889DFCA|nr:Mrp/NBP35 family ATP-binding protein [uncultured Anaerococcus sp.]
MENKKMNFDKFKIKTRPGTKIGKIIAVMSGKGGVGKSSIASQLAVNLKNKGYEVGIFDADITGPSIAEAFGINEPVRGTAEGVMMPAIADNGIKIISTNMIIPKKTDPVVWRASIVTSVIKQFYTDVDWGKIDYLVVDMPPGTADVPLTVFQSLPIDGVVAVATPQGLVEMVVEKSLKMAKMMGKNIIGIVENMSYYECPDCGSKHAIFGKSNIEKVAEKYGVDTLVKLPIDPSIASKIDAGKATEIKNDLLKPIVEKIEGLK